MKLTYLVSTTILALAPGLAGAEPLPHELLVFGSGELARSPGVSLRDAHFDEEKIAADVLFSVQKASIKLFGEYLLTNHESDLERLQIGWEPSARSIVWLGRFHQPASVWNSEHHHGQFLQTSITRPASEDWEDEAGIIPQHFLGALWESAWHLGSSGRGLQTALGAGVAPILTPEGLEPVDLLRPNLNRHKFGAQARIAYLPQELGDTSFGLLLSHNELAWRGPELSPSPVPAFDHIDQSVIGTFARYESYDWKVQAALYHVTTWFDHLKPAEQRDSFLVGYAQADRRLADGVELFARHEDTSRAENSPYLQLFPHFVNRRSTLGGRWQFAREHALSVEISDSHTRDQDYLEYRLQWSAALL